MADVAQTIDGAENMYLAAWANKTPGVVLNIQRQPGANVIQVVDQIKALLGGPVFVRRPIGRRSGADGCACR